MSEETDNHGYATPSQGTENWHEPLNANFEHLDVDVEVRDVAENRGAYEPTEGAKFLELDTGIVYVGDGEEWTPALAVAYYNEDGELECGALADCFDHAPGDPEDGAQSARSSFGTNAHAVHEGAIVFGDSTQRGIWSESLDEVRSQMPIHAPSVHTRGARMDSSGLDADSVEAISVDATSVETTSMDATSLTAGGIAAGADEDVLSVDDETVESEVPIYAPSFENGSSSALKTAVDPVDPEAVLTGLESLSIATWEFRAGDDTTHMGPMAEDFHDAFGLGRSTESIATVDADGVAFAAIQGLATRLGRETDRLRESLAQRDARLEDQKAEMAALRERLDSLESRVDRGGDGTVDPAGETPTVADD